MVTSNKPPEKKVVKMGEHNSGAVVPQRTLLGEVNEHITCPLCRGYYIDATTIVECLHSFCRSCIILHLKAKSYCPVCGMMINSAKPNIKPDKALQDIVYKLVPGLFQKEMERRQTFYASRPGPAASATPEQRGEDTERIIFSPEDVISFSLEYSDATDTDSISSKSSDSNEPPTLATNRRYLQCPAVVNISHLKKFLSMKFDIDSTQFAIDILYKRVPLPDYYTLMDIAYIYNWKRNEPMRFFYQIIDYVAIRNRIFEINRKTTINENKASPALTEDTNTSSPAPNLVDQASEVSSGTDSPMPDESKQTKKELSEQNTKSDKNSPAKSPSILPKKNDDEVEKSQFLNSFELKAKSNCVPKTSPGKSSAESSSTESTTKTQQTPPKVEEKLEPIKRKILPSQSAPELKKLKIEIEKAKLSNSGSNSSVGSSSTNNHSATLSQSKASDPKLKTKETGKLEMGNNSNASNATPQNKDIKQRSLPGSPQPTADMSGLKRPVPSQQNLATPKRKPPNEVSNSIQQPIPKTVSPLKIPVPKMEHPPAQKQSDPGTKPPPKKMPDLKPGVPTLQSAQNKTPPINKVRMDLLANNSDPTIDRSKILSQVKSSLSGQTTPSPSGGDPLKSLFDSCKINIPSSLSITLTDQKLDPRNPTEQATNDPKKNVINKNLAAASNALSHKIPSPPVHNYIEILKLPDSEGNKKPNKSDSAPDAKPNNQPKNEPSTVQPKPPSKPSETSAKGPIPNLKPIADTKLGKQQQQAANYSGSPITFQQTFEQQIQTLQTDKKPKLPKNKAQVPKLVPATPKSLSAANKPNPLINKPSTTTDVKTGAALDLSSPHVQTPPGAQTFGKAFETMQTIANLAKKQSMSTKGLSPSMSQNTSFSSMSNRPLNTGISPLRIPGTMSQIKTEKTGPSGSQISNRQELVNKPNLIKPGNSSSPTMSSPGYQTPSQPSQPSPRQTRSPSSSPKLVIAEEKQGSLEQNVNQSNQITSTQLTSSNTHSPKLESQSPIAGPSKLSLKKSIASSGKLPSRQPMTPPVKTSSSNITNSPDYIQPQLMAQHALMRRQMEINAAWLKARQYDFDMFKNSMSNMAHQAQNDFNKDKQ